MTGLLESRRWRSATPPSGHERHRARLAALADDALLAGAIASTPARIALDGGPLLRRHERFRPDDDAYATLALQDAGVPEHAVRIDAFVSRPPVPAGDPGCVRVPGAGWMLVRPPPADPGLPTLAAAFASPAHRRVVRYRPGRRCTLRLQDERNARYLRVGAGARDVHERQRAAWRTAARGELAFAVARPLGVDDAQATAWQEELVGEAGEAVLYGPAGLHVAARMGAAAASLTTSSIAPGPRLDAAACLGAATDLAAELRGSVPALAPGLDEMLHRLHGALAERGAARPLRPVHGDMNPPNWVAGEAGLALVDFEHLALGDPELDVATWTAEVEAETEAAVAVDELAAAFARSFERAAGPLDARLLAGYRAHRRLWKVVKAARAVRPDGDARAQRRLEAALLDTERELA